MDTKRVVDVPKERMASPGLERETIDDGLSPVNGATIQSAWDIVSPCSSSILAGNTHRH